MIKLNVETCGVVFVLVRDDVNMSLF